MAEQSINDLRPSGCTEYRQVPTGEYVINRIGNRVPVTKGIEYIVTKGGKIEKDEWVHLIETAVCAEGKEELLERIESHCRAHCAWLHGDKEIRAYALECLCSEAYKHWKDVKEGSA